MLGHTPVHARGRQQVDRSCSIIQRKGLPPNACADLEALRLRLACYEALANPSPKPFQWQLDRAKLPTLCAQSEARHMALAEAHFPWLEEAA